MSESFLDIDTGKTLSSEVVSKCTRHKLDEIETKTYAKGQEFRAFMVSPKTRGIVLDDKTAKILMKQLDKTVLMMNDKIIGYEGVEAKPAVKSSKTSSPGRGAAQYPKNR